MSQSEATRQKTKLSTPLSWLLGGFLFEPIRTFSKSVIIVAGPWLLSVFALGVISAVIEPVLGRSATEDLRLTIIYSLCIAPLVAGPMGAITARLIRKSIDEDDGHMVPEFFLSALIGSGTLTSLLAMIVCIVLGITDQDTALAFVFLSVATALLWTCLSVLSAMRCYGFLIVAFGFGMLFCLLAAVLAASVDLDIHKLVWAFASGIVFCVALVMARIVDCHKRQDDDLRLGIIVLANEIIRQKYLVFGILLAFCGVWVDKWVLWASPVSERSLSGFLHYSSYDGVMFLAHLSIIPTFAAMHILHEEDVTDAIKRFRRTMNRRANFSTVNAAVNALVARVWNGIFLIVFVQATITASLVLIAPIMSQLMHFDFRQFLMLRVGLLAVFVHSIFYVSSSVLVVCGRHRLFFIVQLVFFLANLLFSIAFFLAVGPSAQGIFAASLIAALICFLVAYRSLQKFHYLELVGENEALFDRG